MRLADVQRVRYLNPQVESEVRRALETLAQSHDARKRAVSLRFAGDGKRRVKVGYVVEAPVWKTSYRLVLPAEGEKADERPYLQGWAVVENATEEDWRDVRPSLVSGRPISFRMDLYTSLYADRPVVQHELFGGLRPVAYGGAMMEPQKAVLSALNDADDEGGGGDRLGQAARPLTGGEGQGGGPAR